jgi:hypothetical protein
MKPILHKWADLYVFKFVVSLSLTVVEVGPVSAGLLASAYQPVVSGVQPTTQ